MQRYFERIQEVEQTGARYDDFLAAFLYLQEKCNKILGPDEIIGYLMLNVSNSSPGPE